VGGLLIAGVALFWFFGLGTHETIVLLIIAVLLFGRNLPDVGRYPGKGIVEFKKGIRGLQDEPDLLDQPRTEGKKAAPRRATVRYYSRMNPERVYPLLVLITRGQVEKIHKKHTDQRMSAPFAVDVDAPVEIEPVLPGCDCHPPRVVTRLGQGDRTLTFRVVPRVLGRVDGAVVSIRQDHACLAEVELDVRVVKRTLVALSGAAAFLLPGLSAVMKHFGLDFETQKEQGFSLYLAVAQLLFDRVSPLALTALLGVPTALLWWLTRPRTRDVFWDVEKVGGEEELEQITA
jgi:TatA/E family protein of Tat protein translocase